MDDTAETRALLHAGRLEQVCPIDCRDGWRRSYPGPEAAGSYCTACGTPTGPRDWRIPPSQSRREAIGRLNARRAAERALPRQETRFPSTKQGHPAHRPDPGDAA